MSLANIARRLVLLLGGAHAACLMGGWSDWGECSLSCGGVGQRTRTRAVFRRGTPCTFARVQQASCGRLHCPVDCLLGAWGAWERCSHSCGVGATRWRKRPELAAPTYGGRRCSGDDLGDDNGNDVAAGGGDAGAGGTVALKPWPLRQRRACPPLPPCPQDCELSRWGAWRACSRHCGEDGRQVRTRAVARRAAYGGRRCTATGQLPRLAEHRGCNLHPCPRRCIVTVWGAWSACAAAAVCRAPGVTCNSVRTRRVLVPAIDGICPPLRQARRCTLQMQHVPSAAAIATAAARSAAAVPAKGAVPAVHVGLPGTAFAQQLQESQQPLQLPPHAQSRVTPQVAGAHRTEHLTTMARLSLRVWQHWAPALVACSLFFALLLLRGVWRALQRWQEQHKFGAVGGGNGSGGGEQLVEMGGMGLRGFASLPQQAAEQAAEQTALRAGASAGAAVASFANSRASAAGLAAAAVPAEPVHPTKCSYAQQPDTGRGSEAESFGFDGGDDADGIML